MSGETVEKNYLDRGDHCYLGLGRILFVTSFFFAGFFYAMWLDSVEFSMTNDEIIAEVKKCNDASLVGQVIFDKQQRYVIGVQCITKIKESVEGPVTSSEA